MNEVQEVEVVTVKPHKIHIRRGDQSGVIRRREWVWDRRVGAEVPTFAPGQKIKAVYLEDDGKTHFWSIRRCSNPWETAASQYAEGGIAMGEVVNVLASSIWVQLEPGVTAILRQEDVPLRTALDIQFQLGDFVQAVIKSLDVAARRMSLSVTARLTDVMRKRRRNAAYLPVADELPEMIVKSREFRPISKIHEQRKLQFEQRTIQFVLILDDDPEAESAVYKPAMEAIGADYLFLTTRQEVERRLDTLDEFDCAIIDLNLSNGQKGLHVGQMLQKRLPRMPLLFTSGGQLLEVDRDILKTMGATFIPKNKRQIVTAFHAAEDIDAFQYEHTENEQSFIAELDMESFANTLAGDAITRVLFDLRRSVTGETNVSTRISFACVLEVDPAEQQVKLLAAQPSLPSLWESRMIPPLYKSPVRQIVENGKPFYATHIRKDDTRFRNFFGLLEYKSVLGMPILIPGMALRHILIVTHEKQPLFTDLERDFVQEALVRLQVVIERQMLLDYMRRYEERYTIGNLLTSLIHEVGNKLQGIQGTSRALHRLLDTVLEDENIELNTVEDSLDTAWKLSHNLLESQQQMEKLVGSFMRSADTAFKLIDINGLVKDEVEKFRADARDRGVFLSFQFTDAVLRARTIETNVRQVVINLLLNALQQSTAHTNALLQSCPDLDFDSVVRVQTFYMPEDKLPIKIAVSDNAAGIHRNDCESIFQLDTSQREGGHGMGLFVSRNLMNQVGGSVRCACSFRMVGSAFVIELPEEKNGA